jgi:hypothetical protein
MGAGAGTDPVVRAAAPAGPRLAGDDPRLCCTLWLDEQGYVLDCCEHARWVIGYRREEVRGLHVSALLPALAGIPLLQGSSLNPRLAFKCRCSTFRAVDRDGAERDCFLFINVVGGPGGTALTMMVARLA